MKNNYFYLRKDECGKEQEVISKYEFTFKDSIENFLKDLASKYPRFEFIDLREHKLRACKNIEQLKIEFTSKFGEVEILEYFDYEGNKLENFNSSCIRIKVSRPPVIHDIIARFWDYQKDLPRDIYDSFKDINTTNLVKELKAWYERSKISAIKLYSETDRLNFAVRCIADIDKHISKTDKERIVREMFEHLILNSVESVMINDAYAAVGIFSSFKTYNSDLVLSELNNIIESSGENSDFLKSIGLTLKYIDNKDKSVIVISNLHGLVADLNLFTGKITHVTKCFNNTNDSSKEHVYYEKSEIVDVTKEYVEATAEDIYSYRENYYLLDGTRPFLNMTVEEIEAYLEKNK